jgi:hypothetical protein
MPRRVAETDLNCSTGGSSFQLATLVGRVHNARTMALGLTTRAPAANRVDLGVERPQTVSTADVPLFRFGLRQLFVFVAAVCALLAAMGASSGLTSLILLLAVAVVVMHVFATALGTKLQSRTEQAQLRLRAAQPAINESRASTYEQLVKLQAIRAAPRSPWHGRGCTYLPWLPRLVVGTMVVGGLGGGILLGGTVGHRTSLEGIIVGAASFAVLGGWIAFLGGNFYGVFRHGFREALTEQQKDQASHTTRFPN